MNFFKSILLDDEDPPKPENASESGANSVLKPPQEDLDPHEDAEDGNADGWSFGSLIKTFATRSESMIETYRRDLQEFGSGLRKESEIIREAANRAVKDLPASLEAGTTAAHGVLDGVLKSTADIISKEAQMFGSDGEQEAPETNRSLNSGRYSWFEAQWNSIQSDLNTFCEEPENVEEYEKWKSKFELEDKNDEIEGLIGENGVLDGVYKKVVPSVVDHETFWCRYFYRVDKLKQQERVRANLVKRAISIDDDDELSWDVDDEEEKDGSGSERTSSVKLKGGNVAGDTEVSDGSSKKIDGSNGELQVEKGGGEVNVDDGDGKNAMQPRKSSGNLRKDEKEVKFDETAGAKTDEKVKSEESVKGEKNNENVVAEKGESSEKGDVSAVSNHQAKTEEDDLEWDEIEDVGSEDEKKISTTSHEGRPNRADLRKQLNAAEEDDDLSWDIEDDDEPMKS